MFIISLHSLVSPLFPALFFKTIYSFETERYREREREKENMKEQGKEEEEETDSNSQKIRGYGKKNVIETRRIKIKTKQNKTKCG